MNDQEFKRLQAKTSDQRFVQLLEDDFDQAPRVAQAVLEEAKSCFLGDPGQLLPGQVRMILTNYRAGHGQSLRDTPMTEVVWTVDAGAEDREVLCRHGRVALRRVRIQRLLLEAIRQGAVATQEDLAQVLHVSVRTIKRDCASLQAQGIYLPSRGRLRGIGRGQTHKAQIVGRWLLGETYDQIVLRTHHTATSVRRYIRAFVRVVDLHRRCFSESQIALLSQMSIPLVREYLAVYRQHDSPECRERLKAQLQRFCRASGTPRKPKRGAR